MVMNLALSFHTGRSCFIVCDDPHLRFRPSFEKLYYCIFSYVLSVRNLGFFVCLFLKKKKKIRCAC